MREYNNKFNFLYCDSEKWHKALEWKHEMFNFKKRLKIGDVLKKNNTRYKVIYKYKHIFVCTVKGGGKREAFSYKEYAKFSK